jgi:GNAT superfamily N-acetyltransferase
MPIRLARVEDESTIAALCAAAFWKEDCFCRVVLPKHEEFPDDVKIFWHEWLRADWQERGKVILAAVVGEEQPDARKIIGVAVWQRKGNDEHARKVHDEWIDPGKPGTMHGKLFFVDYVGPHAFLPLEPTHNRALDPATANILQEAEPYIAHHFEGIYANSWYLHLLAVHPAFQYRGFGRELIEWGLEKAREEGMHASVISSDSKEPFYFACGFDSIVGSMTDGKGNPLGLRNMRGGAIMFMWRACSPEALEHSS